MGAAPRPEADFGEVSPAWLMSPTAARTTAPGTTGTGGVGVGVPVPGEDVAAAPEAPGDAPAAAPVGEAKLSRAGSADPEHPQTAVRTQAPRTAARPRANKAKAPPTGCRRRCAGAPGGPCWHGNPC